MPLVAALVIGVLAGAAGVGATWVVTRDDTADTPRTKLATAARGDARGACDALAHFDESKFTAKGDEGLVAFNRWGGAVMLSAAAAADDPAYKPLSDALNRAQRRQVRVFDFDAEVKKDVAEARRICTDI